METNQNTSSTKTTGFIYHPDMLKHATHFGNKEKSMEHSENPERLRMIIETINKANFKDQLDIITEFEVQEEDKLDISNTHSERYYHFINNLWKNQGNKDHVAFLSSYYNAHTSRAARLAVQALKICIDRLYIPKNQPGHWDNAFAAVRPPGHHAGMRGKMAGYCFFNNVGVAAHYARRKYGAKKIAIFDWDVHVGDGTRQVFEEDENVLYISFHRYDDGKFYPKTTDGAVTNIGKGKGKGYCLNLPWTPRTDDDFKNVDDNEYIYAFERLALPLLKEFNPDLMIISSGFDCCKGDPKGKLGVTQDALCYIASKLKTLAQGKLLVALEGGYKLENVIKGTEAVIRTILGEEMPNQKSETQLSATQLYQNMEPSYHNFQDIIAALNEWSIYWPVLFKDQNLIQMEKEIKKKIERRHHIVVSSSTDLISYNPESKQFVKTETAPSVISFYKELKACPLPSVVEVKSVNEKTGEASEVVLKDWGSDCSNYNYLKIDLFGPEDKEIDQVVTQFSLAGGLKLNENGPIFLASEGYEGTDFSISHILRFISKSEIAQFCQKVDSMKQIIEDNSTLFDIPTLTFSLVVWRSGDDSDLNLLLSNPSLVKEGQSSSTLAALNELSELLAPQG